MKAVQKLVRNGNATYVAIPRPMLMFCDLVPGQLVIVDVLEDKSLHVRLPRDGEFAPHRPVRLVFDEPSTVKP